MNEKNRVVSRFQLRAAVEVARLLDESRMTLATVDHSYITAVTGGRFSSDQLAIGEALLHRASLILLADGEIVPTETLGVLAALDDEQAILVLASALGVDEDAILSIAGEVEDDSGIILPVACDDDRVALGLIGELAVYCFCREELICLHEHSLAEKVQQVSQVSDALGYDVVAPTLNGRLRLLEVKTQAGKAKDSARFFLTRNEYELGRRQESWALVFCDTPARILGDARIRGWCRVETLLNYVPQDRNSRWTEALVQMPLSVLNQDVPSAF